MSKITWGRNPLVKIFVEPRCEVYVGHDIQSGAMYCDGPADWIGTDEQGRKCAACDWHVPESARRGGGKDVR